MPRPSSSAIQSSNVELIAIQLEIEAIADAQLPSNYPYFLHAWFLDQMRQMSPVLSQQLHDNQEEKAFTLSGFLGPVKVRDRLAWFRAQDRYCCVITGLNAIVCQVLMQWCDRLPQEIVLQGVRFAIVAGYQVLPERCYSDCWEQAQRGPLSLDNRSLTFVSATGFRKAGNHMPLPIPENVLQSYLRRWNIFSSIEFEQDAFLAWVNECIVIVHHQIRSQKVQVGKAGSVTGFIGTVELGFTSKADKKPDFVKLTHTLLDCAPYFGTGHKVTFGLGQTRSGWLLDVLESSIESPIENSIEPETIAPTEPELVSEIRQSSRKTIASRSKLEAARKTLIEERSAELEQIFFSQKKRQGGDRARKSAQIWALILARYEIGENLKLIAEDLNLPYETVKKYAQLARKTSAEIELRSEK
jgi:CRISPR-associated endoribonuclease Cas6